MCARLLAVGAEKSAYIKNKKVSCRAAEVFLPLTVMVCGRLDQRTLGSKVALRDLSPAAQKFVTAAFLTIKFVICWNVQDNFRNSDCGVLV